MRGAKANRKQSSAPSATISVRVQPRASKNEFLSRPDGSFKARLTAPPVDGAANEALIRLVADVLGVAMSAVEIVSGHSARNKIVRVTGMMEDDVKRLLNEKSK